MNRIQGLLDSNVPPEEIAFVSFTKAACTEAKERAIARFCFEDEQLPWFRTVHSTALRMIGGRIAGDVMTDRHWKHFADYAKCEFTSTRLEEGTAFYLAFQSDGDQMRAILDLSRGCLISIEQAMLKIGRAAIHISATDVRTFAKRLHEFKAESRLIDFSDMLELALRAPRKPPVSIAFVDEAQDLTPIQNRLVRHWFCESRCESLTLAGDDDQAIFTFAGADPDELIAASREHPTQILDQSWRIPASVHRMAQSIIEQNRNRVPKEYKPRPVEGTLVTVRDAARALEGLGGPAMALVRNRKFAGDLYGAALSNGLLFSCEAGIAAPLDKVAILGAYRAVTALRAGRAARAADFAHFISQVPSKDGATEILPRGVKTKVEENEQLVTVGRARVEFGLGSFLDHYVLGESDPFRALVKLEKLEREYLGKIAARYGQTLPAMPQLVITTMHKSKGREAHTVILCSEMAGPSHDELLRGDTESEHRVAYVASTRAKDEMRVIRPETDRSYPYEKHMRRVS
jgi:superfamily I DNA/RNA helicase